MGSFPLVTDYTNAIRNSKSRCATLDIEVEMDERGFPKMFAGNFAAVYRAKNKAKGTTIAVKCFLRDVDEVQKRYKVIAQTIRKVKQPLFCSLKFLPEEIFVTSTTAGNGSYPVVIMPWIEGRTMSQVIQSLVEKNKSKGLASMTKMWARFSYQLLATGIAHGDLKHDNILATQDAHLKLIDLESMYVPGLKGMESPILGGPAYQHPKRKGEHFDRTVDHFSILVITLSLRALASEPGLYKRCNNGENIIFTKKDFKFPQKSKLIAHLRKSKDPYIKSWTNVLVKSCENDSIAIPPIAKILKQAVKAP